MITTIKNMFKVKELRMKLLFTFGMILLIRFGSQLPVPGINTEYFKNWFAENSTGAFNILSAFTGGSFERFSLFALGITPYITATIVIQLLSIVFPYLEELRKDGDYGKKKLDWINRYTAIGLALLESIVMSIGFGRSGLLPNMTILRGIVIVVCLTCGSALLILIGELITKKGIGNGISIVLAVNILSGIPNDFAALYETFVKPKTVAKGSLSALIILAIVVLTIVLVIILNEATRKVPVHYSNKLQSKYMTGQQSFIPIKVNISSVIPVIFASSILSIPQMIASATGKGYGSGASKYFLNMINQNNWFDPSQPLSSIGLIIYIAMIFFFAYFYASITFNPIEVADNIKKQGGVIPGIRQGKPTEDYLSDIISKIIIIGSIALIIIVMIPIFFSGMFGANVSFGGTSIIIIVGVVLETIEQAEAQMQARKYEGFLTGGKAVL